MIIEEGFKVVRSRRKLITQVEAELFYADHKGKFFYNRLLTFMCSGPSDIHILAGHDAISKWRKLMGPTKVYQAQFDAPNTIRGMYGLSDTRNATHGSGNDIKHALNSLNVKISSLTVSDSPESVAREISIFFKDFDIKLWLENEEIFYNLGKLTFDPSSFIHVIDKTKDVS